MAMRMLEAGGLPLFTDSVRTADQSNPNGYYEHELVKTLDSGDSRWLAGARGKGVKVVSSLLTYLPDTFDYRVIFMTRHLDEIIASQNAMLEARGDASTVDDNSLKAAYRQHLEQVERFVARRRCFSMLTVDYGDVVERPASAALRINAFLGGQLDVTRMRAVANPALYRNRRP
jgi:hypothetical protein